MHSERASEQASHGKGIYGRTRAARLQRGNEKEIVPPPPPPLAEEEREKRMLVASTAAAAAIVVDRLYRVRRGRQRPRSVERERGREGEGSERRG